MKEKLCGIWRKNCMDYVGLWRKMMCVYDGEKLYTFMERKMIWVMVKNYIGFMEETYMGLW